MNREGESSVGVQFARFTPGAGSRRISRFEIRARDSPNGIGTLPSALFGKLGETRVAGLLAISVFRFERRGRSSNDCFHDAIPDRGMRPLDLA